MKTIFYFYLIALIGAQNNPTYNLFNKYNKGEIDRYSTDFTMSMTIPGYGDLETGKSMVSERQLVGKQDGMNVFTEKIEESVFINKIGNDVSPNYDWNALVGVPYEVYVNDKGHIDRMEMKTNKELEETLNALMRGAEQQNYYFPFGENAKNISIGESWTVKQDSIVFYAGEGDLECFMFTNSKFTLKKIKIKKGRQIAYINESLNMRAELNMMQMGLFMTGDMSGESKISYRFDLDAGKILLKKTAASYNYDFDMEDMSFRSTLNMSEKTKKVK